MQEEQELPKGWVIVKFGDVISTTKGKMPKDLSDEEHAGLLPYIDIKAFEKRVFRSFTSGNRCVLCNEKDILMVWDGARCGLVGRGVGGVIGSTLAKLSAPEYINQSYLFYFAQSHYDTINKQPRGVGIPHVEPTVFKNLAFPLPPLLEQRRIVAKLEELFSRLDAGVAAVRQSQQLLKRYRQSVLHAAVTGALTSAWRTAHPAPEESGAALLARIRAERRAQWEAAQQAKNGGRLPLDGAWKNKYEEPAAVDTSELPELPEGWVWARMSQISDATGGFAFSSQIFSDTGDYQVIKIANVKPGKLVLDSRPAYIAASAVKEDVISRYSLKKDDCVITLTGTREKRDYGFVCRVKEESHLLLNQRLAYIRFSPPLSAQYFEYALVSKHFQDNFFKYETGNVGQGNVGMRAITDESIMLPPLAEQAEIVSEVERRLSTIDALELTLAAELKRAERLRQSLLHRAFTGRLVPQDATDEPAGELLARLQSAPSGPAKAKASRTKAAAAPVAGEGKRRGRPRKVAAEAAAPEELLPAGTQTTLAL